MNRKKLLIVSIAIIALSMAAVTTSYGYWTDKLRISGQSNFEYSLSIVKDVEVKNQEPVIENDESGGFVTEPDTSEDLISELDISEGEDPEKDDGGEL